MRRPFIRGVFLVLTGLALGRIYLQIIVWEPYPHTGLADMIAGTADRPFITRALAPLVIHGISVVMGWPIVTAAIALVYISMIGWVAAMAWLADAVLPAAQAWAAPFAAAGPVCLLFIAGGYTYDLPTLALFALALGLLARERWNAYLTLFPVIALCRETAVLLIPVYWLWARRPRQTPMPRRSLAVGLGIQLLAFGLIRGGLAWLYRDNGGGAFQTHWAEHLDYLLNNQFANILALSLYGAALVLVLYRWRTQPPFLQDAAIIIPPMFLGYWLVGYPGEVRVVLDAYPPLFLLAFGPVWERLVEPTVNSIRRAISKAPTTG
jgi:hypothetical protein